MTKSSKKIRTSSIKEYDPIKLNDTLFRLQEMFERVGVKFFLIENTLSEVQVGQLKTPITIGVREVEDTKSLQTVFEVNLKPISKRGKISKWECDGIPVTIKFVNKDNPAYVYPDVTFYDHTSYNVPNDGGKRRYA